MTAPRSISTALPRRAPRAFVRLLPSPDSDGVLLLQTAIITYTSPYNTDETHENQQYKHSDTQLIRIHSLLHLADRSYYDSLQSDLASLTRAQGSLPSVLFELLTASSNLDFRPFPRLKVRPFATNPARANATALRAVAQVDALDFSQPGWRHADLTSEMVSSIPSPKYFIANPIILFLRGMLFILPFPELYAILIDLAAGNAQFPTRAAFAIIASNSISAARRLLFAIKMTTFRVAPPTTIDRQRNAEAWSAVRSTVTFSNAPAEIALLYGAWHTSALCQCAETDGWSFKDIQWRTAMTLSAPRFSPFRSLVFTVSLIAYGSLAAVDWVSLVARIDGMFGDPHSRTATVAETMLYTVRHVAPYIAFRRWFRDWKFE